MQEIMQYLKANGQRFDSEIAAATGLSLAKVRRSISDLSARGEISKCSVTRFSTDGEKVEAVLDTRLPQQWFPGFEPDLTRFDPEPRRSGKGAQKQKARKQALAGGKGRKG